MLTSTLGNLSETLTNNAQQRTGDSDSAFTVAMFFCRLFAKPHVGRRIHAVLAAGQLGRAERPELAVLGRELNVGGQRMVRR